MRWSERRFPIEVVRKVDPSLLAVVDAETVEEADDVGYLAGNGMFQDLSGFRWTDAAAALTGERRLIARLQAAKDLDAEAMRIEDKRARTSEPSAALWNLDVGVIAAVIAVSALGATPVASCNAGAFGGRHQASHPYVALFLPAHLTTEMLQLAETARVGVIVDEDGLVRLYSDRGLGLLNFAELAVSRHGR